MYYLLKKDKAYKNDINDITEKQSFLLLTLMVLGTLAFVFIRLLLNGKAYIYIDTGADTAVSYLPSYTGFVNNLFNGKNDLWSMQSGLGDTLYTKSTALFEPVLICVLLLTKFIGVKYLPIMLIIYKCIIVSGSAFLCYNYLNLFSDKKILVTIFSYLYAFNGFSIIWGQHYFFSSYCFYMILITYLIERMLRNDGIKNSVLLYIGAFICMSYTAYMTYMIFVCMIFYSIIRYFIYYEKFRLKHFMIMFMNMAFVIIVGFLSSSFISYPSTRVLLTTGRIGGGESVFKSLVKDFLTNIPLKGLIVVAQRFISGNYSGIADSFVDVNGICGNYYEAPQLFFSIFIWVILGQFFYLFIIKTENKKKRFFAIVSVLLVILIIVNNGVKSVLYAFSGSVSRVSFVIFPFLALACVMTMDYIVYKKKFSVFTYLLSVIFSAILLTWSESYIVSDSILQSQRNLISVNIIVFCIGIIVLMIIVMNDNKKYLLLLFSCLIMINVCSEMDTSTSRNGNILLEQINKVYNDNSTRKAISYINSIDSSLYRIEKNYRDCSIYTDSLIYGYNSVSEYNSAISEGLKKYFEYYFDSSYSVEGLLKYRGVSFIYGQYDFVPYSQLCLRYILSHEPLLDEEHYRLINKIEDVYIYKNIYANSFLTLYDEAISESDFLKLNYYDRNKVLSEAIVVSDDDADEFDDYINESDELLNEYNEKEIEGFSENNACKNNVNDIIINLKKDWFRKIKGDAYVEFEILSDTQSNIYYELIDSAKNESKKYNFLVLGNIPKKSRYMIPVTVDAIHLYTDSGQFSVSDFRGVDVISPVINEKCTSDLNDLNKNGSVISGDYSVKSDGILLIPIPYDTLIHINVDGKTKKKYEMNSGLTAIITKAGNHKIDVYYYDDNNKLGIIISVITVIIFMAYCGIRIKKKKPIV